MVSGIMLGLITLLAALSADASPLVVAALSLGWILMPTLLHISMARPRARYLLALPATLVAVGLLSLASNLDAGSVVVSGWWLVTAGVLFGGGLGTWFWYRIMPVPESLDDPFSIGRITLIAIHVALILVGLGLVISA